MRFLLVDDHAVVRAGLRRLLAALPGVEISRARELRPDVVLLDLNLPGLGGLELLRRVLLEHPTARVMVLSMHAEALYAARALQAGAAGYLSKNASPEELLEAIRRVAAGGRYIEGAIAQELALQTAATGNPVDRLTSRDLEILRLLGRSQSLAQIAEALGISYKTVANACSGIKAKLGVARTGDLVRLSIEMGIV